MGWARRLLLLAAVAAACSAEGSGGGDPYAGGTAAQGGTAGAAGAAGEAGSDGAGTGGQSATGGTSAGTSGAGAVAGTGAAPADAAGGTAGAGGAGGAAGAPGTGGAAGAGNVTFDWPETPPGTGQCKSGHYVGAFNGTFTPSSIFVPAAIPVTGNVDLTLAESPSGEFFDITDGKVTGEADAGLFGKAPYSCDVQGKLNCITHKVDNGYLANCKYTAAGSDHPFEGPLQADYDTLTYSFVNGTWNVKEPNPIYGGSGTWNATWTP